MNKIPKARCEKCEYCKLITMDNDVTCEILNKRTYHKPKFCADFKKHEVVRDMDFCGVLCNYAEELIKKAKSEARKEFVERLCEGRVSNDPVVIAAKVQMEMENKDV